MIEFQHSPITGEEIAKRNDFYLSCGYKVVWVFDATDKIKNYIENSIDPMKCLENDLGWKRSKRQFAISIPPQVTVYLQYKSFTSSNEYPDQEFDIMLLLTKITPRDFTFYKTLPYYILPNNFLKEYGAVLNDNVLSITDIINYTKQVKRKQEVESNRRLYAIPARNLPKRRWWL